MAQYANFCGKIWQNLGFQMPIFCDARFMPSMKLKMSLFHNIVFTVGLFGMYFKNCFGRFHVIKD